MSPMVRRSAPRWVIWMVTASFTVCRRAEPARPAKRPRTLPRPETRLLDAGASGCVALPTPASVGVSAQEVR